MVGSHPLIAATHSGKLAGITGVVVGVVVGVVGMVVVV
jgi:hypothetical protein